MKIAEPRMLLFRRLQRHCEFLFPTDMQAPAMALLCTAEGTSLIVETVFENRFLHAAELQRMGGNVKVEGRSAFVEGRRKLSGAKVSATDLRAGAALNELGADIQKVMQIDPSQPKES